MPVARKTKRTGSTPVARMRSSPPWARWSRERLLDMRLCDLGLHIKGSALEERCEQLQLELEEAGLNFRPHFWLSDEWFSPGGIPGVALPFYLTHPTLMKLERSMMNEVEGGSRASCMRLLRHEAGHALQHAFEVQRSRRWSRLFGRSSQPYPVVYRPRPFSKRFVHHLDAWYAQSHPDEDFAETFAVWLGTRRGTWRRRYAGWPALKKLEFVDVLMEELRGTRPEIRSRRTVDPISKLRKTLRQHYDDRRVRYSIHETPYDRDLRELFSDDPRHRQRESAARFLRSIRGDLLAPVSRWTGQPTYTADQVLTDIIARARALKLRLRNGRRRTKEDAAVLLTVHTMHYHRRKLSLAL